MIQGIPDLGIPGTSLTISRELVRIQSARELKTLSSAVIGGGFKRVHDIINRHVPLNYNHRDPVEDLMNFAQHQDIVSTFVGMMTAADLPDHAHLVTYCEGGLVVSTLITAGLTNATCAGLSPPAKISPGTINMIIIINGARFSRAAFVNAACTATEAKTHVLLDRGTKTSEKLPATGTSTDSIVIATLLKKDPSDHLLPVAYAGPATLVGHLIARSVREALPWAIDGV